jgi:hypothetical protein
MGWGGPVWHSSASKIGGRGADRELRALAYAALAGVGDRGRGEWVESGEKAFHVRRRLTPAEEALTGPAIDLRGTGEAETRLRAALAWLPREYRGLAAREAGRVLTA